MGSKDFQAPSGASVMANFPYPLLQDLRRVAEEEVTSNRFTSVSFPHSALIPVTNTMSVDNLLKQAAQSLRQVTISIDFQRPDRAYIEGLKCDALIKMLVSHRDYPDRASQRRVELSRIVKARDAQGSMHQTLEDTIRKSNNLRIEAIEQKSMEPRFSSLSSRPRRDELHLSNGDDPLMRRFSALRTTDPIPYPTTDPRPIGLPASPRPSSSTMRPITQIQGESTRVNGPRDMPPVPSNLSKIPPRIAVNDRINTSFPRAPDPIYSPTRNAEVPTHYTSGAPLARPVPSQYTRESIGYGVQPTKGYPQASEQNLKSSRPDLPQAVSVSPQELYNSLKSYDILIMDVRARDAFDEGHIYHKNVICIEPLRLKYGMSFEDLRDTLIFSPDLENQMFDSILDFDLVVYYDQNSSDSFLEGSPKTARSQWLRALFETLVTFNDRAPLRHLPVVLSGGLDAWTDLMGPQSLQRSNTMQTSQSLVIRKPIRRTPHRGSLTGGTSSQEVRLRRLQQYDPLNEMEKRKWQEQLRQEEVKPTDLRAFRAEESLDEEGEELESPVYHRTVDDFIRRFPEVSDLATSMVKLAQNPRSSRPLQMPAMPIIPSRPAPAVSRPSYSGVSDRNASGSIPSSQQDVGAQQPLYRPRLITATYRLPRTGLINYGVTCYMNSTIQCLSATIDLATFFLQDTWKGQVQRNWKGSEGILPDIFSNLIRSLWNHESNAIRPKSLRTFCGRMNPQWAMDRQQDAEEFLMFLLDCLHEDLNVNWNRKVLQPLTEEQELARERLPLWRVSRIEFVRYAHREVSYISDLFAGQHASRLTCLTCSKTSTSYEAFYSLSLEIPQSGTSRITDCLANYTKVEQLEAGEEWKCPHCKVPRAATKRLLITRLPRILAISFKRFSRSSSGKTQKVHTPIDFPLFGLDMRPCMAETRYPPDEDEELSKDAATTPPFLYDAYAVTRHIGNSLESGHYIAMVRDAARMIWRRFDDDRVADFDPSKLRFEDRLQNEQAYMVFYERSRAR